VTRTQRLAGRGIVRFHTRPAICRLRVRWRRVSPWDGRVAMAQALAAAVTWPTVSGRVGGGYNAATPSWSPSSQTTPRARRAAVAAVYAPQRAAMTPFRDLPAHLAHSVATRRRRGGGNVAWSNTVPMAAATGWSACAAAAVHVAIARHQNRGHKAHAHSSPRLHPSPRVLSSPHHLTAHRHCRHARPDPPPPPAAGRPVLLQPVVGSATPATTPATWRRQRR